MTAAIAFLTQHRITLTVIGISLILIGLLLIAGRRGVSLKAKSGGVIVIGNHNGPIRTGTAGSSTIDRVIAIIALLATAIGVMVAIFAWWYPKTPS